jgi:hypothetical protein
MPECRSLIRELNVATFENETGFLIATPYQCLYRNVKQGKAYFLYFNIYIITNEPNEKEKKE